jgi:hypothetical protein
VRVFAATARLIECRFVADLINRKIIAQEHIVLAKYAEILNQASGPPCDRDEAVRDGTLGSMTGQSVIFERKLLFHDIIVQQLATNFLRYVALSCPIILRVSMFLRISRPETCSL